MTTEHSLRLYIHKKDLPDMEYMTEDDDDVDPSIEEEEEDGDKDKELEARLKSKDWRRLRRVLVPLCGAPDLDIRDYVNYDFSISRPWGSPTIELKVSVFPTHTNQSLFDNIKDNILDRIFHPGYKFFVLLAKPLYDSNPWIATRSISLSSQHIGSLASSHFFEVYVSGSSFKL